MFLLLRYIRRTICLTRCCITVSNVLFMVLLYNKSLYILINLDKCSATDSLDCYIYLCLIYDAAISRIMSKCFAQLNHADAGYI